MSAVNEAREVVTSVRIEENERHWRLTVFNRGGNAGTLTVDANDGPVIVARLYTDHAAVRAEALAEVQAKVAGLPTVAMILDDSEEVRHPAIGRAAVLALLGEAK